MNKDKIIYKFLGKKIDNLSFSFGDKRFWQKEDYKRILRCLKNIDFFKKKIKRMGYIIISESDFKFQFAYHKNNPLYLEIRIFTKSEEFVLNEIDVMIKEDDIGYRHSICGTYNKKVLIKILKLLDK